jgi:hypothetical protein
VRAAAISSPTASWPKRAAGLAVPISGVVEIALERMDEDLRDVVARIGPKNPAPFADSLLTQASRALPAANHAPRFPARDRDVPE